MSCLRVRQMTPFGNMHVKISVDPHSGRELEVFAQLGKGGDVANSDLEAICRLLSLLLRCGGSLDDAIRQLEGIGSSLTIPSREGRIMSLGDGLAQALRKYSLAKQKFGLKNLLLGNLGLPDTPPSDNIPLSGMDAGKTPTEPAPKPAESVATDLNAFKVRCPLCHGTLVFAEGCVKCPSCGFSQC